MAPLGYGKRAVTDEGPRRRGDFGHLPEREAYLAAYIDRLPEGAAIDVKSLAKAQPMYGQAAVRAGLNGLSAAGHLRRFTEPRGESSQWVTHTYFSRTARDAAWWAWFRAGGAVEQPASEPVRPARSAAYRALAMVGAADHRMMLSHADCEELEALAAEWLAQGVSVAHVVRELTFRLPPEGVRCPREFARKRLVDKVPPEPAPRPAPRARRIMLCTGCDTPGEPEDLPGGLCHRCRNEDEGREQRVERWVALTPAEVHAWAGRLRQAVRVPEGSSR